MSTQTSQNCGQCGAVLPDNAPAGLCPKCLMALNLSTETVLADDAAPSQQPLSPAELAPHFPQLEILECLGRGGMGVVYKARQKSLNRLVALKLLAPERVADEQFARRFTHEAQALAALNHPSIVTIHDFGQAGGFYFLLMEFVDGVNLRQAMNAGRFTPEQALAVVPPVCEALQYAHDHGIVHRDIKPENLLLDKQGRVKIADFGVAKLLHAGGSEAVPTDSQPAGTPQYMAPEQRAHHRTDHRGDIYSLGVVLYELLTGELPRDPWQPPSRKVQIDVRLDAIVLRALERSPELRYQTAAELQTQVATVTAAAPAGREDQAARAGGGPMPAPPAAPRFLTAGNATSRQTIVVVSLAAALVLAGGMLILRVRSLPAPREAIQQVWCEPVGVSNNVVIVDIVTVVDRGSAEVRAGLVGPYLTAPEEAAIEAELAPGFDGRLIKPMPTTGNPAWKLQAAGRERWRVGFVLPTAALADQARRVWQPFSPFTGRSGAGYATKLFTVRAADGAVYQAEVQVVPPLHAGNPEWVSMSGQSSRSDASLKLTWQIRAAQAGYVRVTRPGSAAATAQLRLNPTSQFHETEVSLELERQTNNQVRLKRTLVGAGATEGFPARFDDLAAEMTRTAQLNAKTLRGERIELCRVKGEPLVIEINDVGVIPVTSLGLLSPTPGAPAARRPTSPSARPQAEGAMLPTHVEVRRTVIWPILFISLTTVVLVCVVGAAVWIVRRLRGSASAIIAALLAAMAAALLALGVGAAFIASRAARAEAEARRAVAAARAEKLRSMADGAQTNAASFPDHIEFRVLRVENPPGTRTLLVHFERDANPGLGLEVWQAVRGDDAPEFPASVLQPTQWIGLTDRGPLSWTLPKPFTAEDARHAAARLQRQLFAQRDAYRKLFANSAPKLGEVPHPDGWSFQLLLRVKPEPAPQPSRF